MLTTRNEVDISQENLNNGIAIMTFSNYSSDDETSYLSSGISEAIRIQIGEIGSVKVISRHSVEKFQNMELSIPEIASKLGVSYILEGSVQQYKNNIQVNTQLIDTHNDTQIWSKSYNRQSDNILVMQSEIAADIAKRLKIETNEEIARTRIINSEAYKNYLMGIEIVRTGNGTIEEMERAISLLDASINNQSDFVPAYLGKAEALLNSIFWGRINFSDVKLEVKQLIQKALDLDEHNSRCYSALILYSIYEMKFQSAQDYFNKAIELDPNNSDAYEWMAMAYFMNGNYKKASTLTEQNLSLDPLNAKYHVNNASYLYYDNQKQKAIDLLKKVKEEYQDPFASWYLAVLYVMEEQYDKAIELLRTREIGTNTNWILGYAYGKTGNITEAQRILDVHLNRREQNYIPAFMISVIYIGMGDMQAAMNWMNIEFEEGPNFMCIYSLKTDPKLTPLYDIPEFMELVKQVPYVNL